MDRAARIRAGVPREGTLEEASLIPVGVGWGPSLRRLCGAGQPHAGRPVQLQVRGVRILYNAQRGDVLQAFYAYLCLAFGLFELLLSGVVRQHTLRPTQAQAQVNDHIMN